MIGVLLLGGAWAVQWAPPWVAVCYMVVAVLVWLWALLRERAANCDDSARYRIMDVIVTVVAGVSMVASPFAGCADPPFLTWTYGDKIA